VCYKIRRIKKMLIGDIAKKEIGGACGTNGGEERYIKPFGGEIFKKEITWKLRRR
jgi:hypothetical protein